MIKRPISIKDAAGNTLTASLVIDVPQDDVEQLDLIWAPYMEHIAMEAHIRRRPTDLPDHVGWNWAYKFNQATANTRFIGLEYRDFMQGMLVMDINPHVCRSSDNQNLYGVYVRYLAAAPWNIGRFMRSMERTPILNGIGPTLMKAAITVSQFVECEGRIVLHSVPKSEIFYRDQCGMKDLGVELYQGEKLCRFEMSKDIADRYLKGD